MGDTHLWGSHCYPGERKHDHDGYPFAKLYLIHLVQTYPLPFWSSFGFLIILTILSWLGSRTKQVVSVQLLSPEDRVHMLQRLRMRYEQLRAQSLQSAVQNAVSFARRVPNQPDHLLSPQTSIVHLHEQARGELLILGEPGAGKSTLLQELAYHLLQQAEQDTTQLLPVYRQRQL